MKRFFTSLLITFAVAIGVNAVLFSVAQAATIPFDPLGGGDAGDLSSDTGLGESDPVVVASQLVNVFLQILGTLCFLLMLYAGWRWVWARGSEEEITKAKDIIRGTVIGLIVILSSYGIMQWVFYYLTRITNAA